MRKVFEYSHLGGSEILLVRYPEINEQIDAAIAAVTDVGKTKASQEKTKQGRLLYSPKLLNDRFATELNSRGFEELRDTYTITIRGHDTQIAGAYKQIDFVKSKVLVEVRFGKYAFMFYDLAKFQYFFNGEECDVGVEIVPCHGLHAQMSSGVSYGEQLIYDIERLKRHFPAVPVKVILVDID